MTATATKARLTGKPAEVDLNRWDVLSEDLKEAAGQLEQISQRYALAVGDTTMGRLHKALLTAQALNSLRKAITPEVMSMIMPLMNSDLGFRTDRPSKKDPTPYPEEVVKECFVQSLLEGFAPFNNEWNIISSRFYSAKNGWKRKVKSLPGLTDLEVIPGVPTVHNGRTVVKMGARWKLDGVPGELRDSEGKPGRVFSIIAYESSTADNIIGKAERKCYRAVWEQITGSEHSAPDGEVGEVIESRREATPAISQSRTEQVADRLPETYGRTVPAAAILADVAASTSDGPQEGD